MGNFLDLSSVEWGKYVGGQAQIKDDKKGTLVRAEISAIVIDDILLKVSFYWAAKNTDPSQPELGEWIMCRQPKLELNLEIWEATDLGQNRLSLDAKLLKQKVVLLSKGDAPIERSKIKGRA